MAQRNFSVRTTLGATICVQSDGFVVILTPSWDKTCYSQAENFEKMRKTTGTFTAASVGEKCVTISRIGFWSSLGWRLIFDFELQ
jgi:hypothetical protein